MTYREVPLRSCIYEELLIAGEFIQTVNGETPADLTTESADLIEGLDKLLGQLGLASKYAAFHAHHAASPALGTQFTVTEDKGAIVRHYDLLKAA